MNEILKSKQQMQERPLQMQFFEPASVWRPSSELVTKSNGNKERMNTLKIPSTISLKHKHFHFANETTIEQSSYVSSLNLQNCNGSTCTYQLY